MRGLVREGLLKGSLGAIAGIASAAFLPGEIPFVLAVGGFVGGILFLFSGIRFQMLWVTGLTLILFSAGVWWFARADEEANRQELAVLAAARTEQRLEGIVAAEPEQGRFVVRPESFEGAVLVFAEPFTLGSFGDRVLLEGRLESPPSFPDFDYPEYLKGRGIFGVMVRPSMEIREKADPSLFGLLTAFRQAAHGKVQAHLPKPLSDLASAMLLGYKSDLSDGAKEQLNRTGLRHLTAISGMHVAIIAGLLFWAFRRFQIGTWKTWGAVSFLLLLFVLLTGLQVSAARAALMGSLVLLAAALGRPADSLRLLQFVALAFLIHNPLLIQDAAFQLSFGAMLGILLFTPAVASLLPPLPFLLRDLLSLTLAAQVFTAPVLALSFHQFSLVSLLANILAVPLLPLIMAAGLLFLLAAFLSSFLASLLAVPLLSLLFLLQAIVSMGAKVPYGFFEVSGAAAALAAMTSFAAASFLWLRRRNLQETRLPWR